MEKQRRQAWQVIEFKYAAMRPKRVTITATMAKDEAGRDLWRVEGAPDLAWFLLAFDNRNLFETEVEAWRKIVEYYQRTIADKQFEVDQYEHRLAESMEHLTAIEAKAE